MPELVFGLSPRDRQEHHRVATPLELLFDLASVIAIAAAAHGLAHAVSAAHALDGVVSFIFSFFAIWWAWMNYTWFASAYDSRRPLFRILSMVIIFGALVMAAGIPALFENKPFFLVWLGFVVMRLAQVTLWLLAARGDPPHRGTSLKYAFGIAAAQIYWSFVFFGFSPETLAFKAAFVFGMLIELAVPVFAEHANNTTWHRHHIIERYGLLNIIVLGEILLAVVSALRNAGDVISLANPLVHVAISATIITCALWWAYFLSGEHLVSHEHRQAILWGYGHVVVFGAGAALGAGFTVLIDVLSNHAKVGLRTGDIAVAIPLALYLGGLWFLRDRFLANQPRKHVFIIAALAILIVGLFLPAPLELMAAITVLAVIIRGS